MAGRGARTFASAGCRRLLLVLLVLAPIAACRAPGAAGRHAVDVAPGDLCAVCGMELAHSPGPRAQAWLAGHPRPVMFDSTRDFFAYVLQPENQSEVQELFVQDASRIDWWHPGRDAGSFIDARSALYVAWQPLPGSMGPTLAPFRTRVAAAAFAHAHGGAVLAFHQVTLAVVADLQYHCPGAASGSRPGQPACLPARDSAASRGGSIVSASSPAAGARSPSPPASSGGIAHVRSR